MNCHLIHHWKSKITKIPRRLYLSHRFTDNTLWLKTLQLPSIPNKSPEQLAVLIQDKMERNQYYSPHHVELLACTMFHLKDMKVFDLFTDILKKFRRSQVSLTVPPSFHHGIVRSLINISKSLSLTDICMDRLDFGVFPDQWASAILVDHHLRQNKITDAFDVVTQVMLQDDMTSSVLQLLSMLVCAKSVDGLKAGATGEESAKKDEPVVYERVDFVENEFYDDHFDVKDPRILCGKILVLAANNFGLENQVCRLLNLLGLAFYEKFDQLELALNSFDESAEFPRDFFEILRNSVENSNVLENNRELPTFAQQRSITPQRRDQLLEMINKFESSRGKTEESLEDFVEKFVVMEIPRFEDGEISAMERTITLWGEEREDNMMAEIDRERREKEKMSVMMDLDSMIRREEVFAYVENPSVVVSIGEKLRPETKKLTGLEVLELMGKRYRRKLEEKKRRLSMAKQR